MTVFHVFLWCCCFVYCLFFAFCFIWQEFQSKVGNEDSLEWDRIGNGD